MLYSFDILLDFSLSSLTRLSNSFSPKLSLSNNAGSIVAETVTNNSLDTIPSPIASINAAFTR